MAARAQQERSRDVLGDVDRHHVRVNFGTVTVKAHVPVARRWSVYGESGLAFTSRTGFALGDTPVVTDAPQAATP